MFIEAPRFVVCANILLTFNKRVAVILTARPAFFDNNSAKSRVVIPAACAPCARVSNPPPNTTPLCIKPLMVSLFSDIRLAMSPIIDVAIPRFPKKAAPFIPESSNFLL